MHKSIDSKIPKSETSSAKALRKSLACLSNRKSSCTWNTVIQVKNIKKKNIEK